MKYMPLLLAGFLLLGTRVADAGKAASNLVTARGAFEGGPDRINAEPKSASDACPRDYLAAVEKLARKAQAAGDLDAVLALNKEKERFAADGTVPAAGEVGRHPRLAEL